MAEAARKLMNVAEFLLWGDGTDRRYELVHGEIVAMAPPPESHGALQVNIAAVLRNGLRRPCRAVAEAGIVLPDRNDTYYQADLAVTCSPGSGTMLQDPVAIIEIQSPSTRHDLGRKLPDYRLIPSVQDILLFSSTEQRVEHWRRMPDGWLVQEAAGAAEVSLQGLGLTFRLPEIYDGIAAA